MLKSITSPSITTTTFVNKFLNPVCDLLDPLYDNTKQEIFGEIIEQYKPPKKVTGPALSGMKKEQLIEECEKNNVSSEGIASGIAGSH
jgi:DNA polymerase delta subunit 1